jgi:hypothetical protein
MTINDLFEVLMKERTVDLNINIHLSLDVTDPSNIITTITMPTIISQVDTNISESVMGRPAGRPPKEEEKEKKKEKSKYQDIPTIPHLKYNVEESTENDIYWSYANTRVATDWGTIERYAKMEDDILEGALNKKIKNGKTKTAYRKLVQAYRAGLISRSGVNTSTTNEIKKEVIEEPKIKKESSTTNEIKKEEVMVLDNRWTKVETLNTDPVIYYSESRGKIRLQIDNTQIFTNWDTVNKLVDCPDLKLTEHLKQTYTKKEEYNLINIFIKEVKSGHIKDPDAFAKPMVYNKTNYADEVYGRADDNLELNIS